MSLVNFIEKLQRKPRYVRKQILWVSVIVCMAVIVSFWIASFKYLPINNGKLEDVTGNDESLETLKEAGKKLPSFGESLRANVRSIFEDESVENSLEAANQEEDGRENSLRTVKPNMLPLAR